MTSCIFILVYESYNPLLSFFILLHISILIELLGTPSNWLLDPLEVTPQFLKHILPLALQNRDMLLSWFSKEKKKRKRKALVLFVS